MRALALDTATAATSVALGRPGEPVLEARDDPPPGARPRHAARLLPFAAALLEEAGLGWESLDGIVVGVGPGTFTGLRIGVATARALAHARGIPLVGISTLAALALPARAAAREAGAAAVLAVIDARRGELFAAAWDAGADAAALARATDAHAAALARDTDAHAAALARDTDTDARAAPLARDTDTGTGADAAALAHAGDALRAPSVFAPAALAAWVAEHDAAVLAVGDGAVLARAELEAAGARVPSDTAPLHRVSAAAHLALAAHTAPGADVLPLYLRAPDARPRTPVRP